jgi:muramidase (phage lysozyme)
MAAGFAISIKLLDLVTGPMRQVNSAIAGLEKNVKKTAREGGLLEVRDALTKIRREASDLTDKLGTVFTPLGGLTAAGSLAGMAALAERFARTGAEVGRTSKLFDVATGDLQNWRGAMRLAGGSAEDATGLIANMGRQLYLARAGMAPDVFRGATQFGLDITKPNIEFLLDAADRLQKMSAQQRRQFASVFNIDERTIALLSRGKAAVREYLDEADRHGKLTTRQIAAAEDLHRAYSGLTLSVESMGLAIGGQIGTWMTPMLEKWTVWLDRARETPATMKLVEIGVGGVAAMIGGTLILSITALAARVVSANTAILATPLGQLLLLGYAGYRAATGGPGSPGRSPAAQKFDEGDWSKWLDLGFLARKIFGGSAGPTAPSALPPASSPGGAGSAAPAAPSALPPSGAGGSGPTSAPGPASPPAAAAPPELKTQTEKPWWRRILDAVNPISPAAAAETGGMRVVAGAGAIPPGSATTTAVPPEARGILAAIASRESEGAARRRGVSPYNIRYTPGGGAAFGDLSKHPNILEPTADGRRSSAAGRYQFTGTKWREEAKRLNLPDFSAASQDRAGWDDAQRVYRRAVGRDLGMDLRNNNFDRRAIPAFQREWTSVRGDLPELANRFGDRQQPYAPPVQSVGGDAAAGLGPTGDTNHHVQVTFANAPEGMRSGLTRAEGPAETSIRTQYALPHF